MEFRFLGACIGAVLIHLTLGTFYSWGNITTYVTSYMRSHGHDVSYGETSFVLATAGFLQGLMMFSGGWFQARLGLRGTSLLGCGVLTLGTALSFWTVRWGLGPFMLTYSILFGIGIGLAYTAPMVCLMEWLPDNKGLACGIVEAGFGWGAFVFSFVQKAWINPSGMKPDVKADGAEYYGDSSGILGNVPSLFLILALCYSLLQLLGAALLFRAPVSTQASTIPASRIAMELRRQAVEMIRTRNFWIIAGCFFFNAQVVIFISSFEKVFGQVVIPGGLSDSFLTVMAACASLCNGFGRIAWGYFGDKYSFKRAIVALCLTQTLLVATITLCRSGFMYFCWICAIFFCIGGNFSLFPAATATYFGQAAVGSNYGVVFLAPGVSFLWGAFLSEEFQKHLSVTDLSFVVAALELCALLCAMQTGRAPQVAACQEYPVAQEASREMLRKS